MMERCLWLMLILGMLTNAPMIVQASKPERIEIKDEKTFISQAISPNSVFVIIGTIDLQGGTITIPQGCTLKFEGGQLKRGKIVGTETYVEASPYPIFGGSLELKGTFISAEAYPEWFESEDDAISIRTALQKFDHVKLTAKHYTVKSVDENGVGIAVPSGRILEGNRRANNTQEDDQIIEMAEEVNYRSVVALSSSTVLSNLTIRGHRNENNSCVSTQGGFQSRLTIERVGVSGAYYGFNLQTYLTEIRQCVASYNEVGFHIHGAVKGDIYSVEGTSVNLSTCFAVDSRKTGYDIAGITYSTMSNCAADGCGSPVSGMLDNTTDIGPGYSFTQCKNLTINSCGVENSLSAVRTHNCKNIIFNSPSFLINKRKEVKVKDDFVMKPIINIRHSVFIEFNYMYLYAEAMSKYYTNNTSLMLLYGNPLEDPSVILRRGYEGIKESNIGTEGFLNKTKNLVYE